MAAPAARFSAFLWGGTSFPRLLAKIRTYTTIVTDVSLFYGNKYSSVVVVRVYDFASYFPIPPAKRLVDSSNHYLQTRKRRALFALSSICLIETLPNNHFSIFIKEMNLTHIKTNLELRTISCFCSCIKASNECIITSREVYVNFSAHRLCYIYVGF